MTRQRVCATAGCPNLTTRTRCPDHEHQAQREGRARYPRNRYGAAWPRIRARQLRQHPTCQCTDPACRCGGQCTKLAIDVDHVVGFRHFRYKRVANASTNLQSLCKPCHSRKTALEVGLGGVVGVG